MTFYCGTVAPPLCHSSKHSRFVSPDAFGESPYFRTGGRFAFYQPVSEHPARLLAEQISKFICQAERGRQFGAGCSNRINASLFVGLAIHRADEQATSNDNCSLVMEEAACQMASLR